MADFYAARSGTIPPLPWSNFAPPLSPRDAATIADLARTRADLRPVETETEIDVDIRLLVGRRREVVVDQTRRLARLRDLLSSLFPALERRIDVKTKAGLVFLSLFAAPHELRSPKPQVTCR